MSGRNHWSRLNETTFVAGVWLLYAVHELLGRRVFRICLFPVVLAHWLLRPQARRASMEFLHRLQAHSDVFGHPPGWRQSLRHFMRFAETLLDKMLAVSGRYIRSDVDYQGQEPLVADIRAGRGGIIITAHMGCLELMQTAASWREGLRLTILVHTAHAERFNRILARLNPAARIRLLQVESLSPATAMELADQIAAGEYIAIAGDRVPVRGERFVHIPFLGRPAPFPTGPYLIASVLGCPTWLMSCLREGNRYRFTVEAFDERIVLQRSDRQAALTMYAERYGHWLESRVAESPYDWFNFFPFWEQTSHGSSARP